MHGLLGYDWLLQLTLSYLAVRLIIQIAVCFFVMKCYTALPPSYRRMSAGLVWLLLIPFFDLVWNFFVFPRLALSYQDFFRHHGRHERDDCGHGLALAMSATHLASLVFLTLANLLSLILLLILLVRMGQLKAEALEASADVFA